MAEPQPSLPRAAADPRSAVRFEELLAKVRAYRPQDSLELLTRAYEFSAAQHTAQRRASGEPFLSHPLEVAHQLAEMRLDLTTLAVGLLHDVVEDTRLEPAALEAQFGRDVARLVEGLTKIGRLEFTSQEAAQAENLRKMLLAMVDDVRVILVKLADRLHNMRTLRHLPEEKRRRVARETLDIYAPLAHRLGMGKVRGELEDLAFAALEPEAEQRIRGELEKQRLVSERFLAEVQRQLAAEIEKNSIPARVDGRVKRAYSLHRKLERHPGIPLEQVYDLLAVRVVTDSVRDCYAALGVVHQLWRPVPGRFKDYIGMPRANLYQSLHTAVIHSSGQPFEVQLRTEEMHRLAEEGIAAHWRYKDGAAAAPGEPERVAWLRQLVDWARELADPGELLATLKVDLYPKEVYTFTPKGKVIVLPREATPVDFAYAIHTEVGHACTGARVNGRLAPLRTRLGNGDIVEILTGPAPSPSRDWLHFARTSRARNKIQHWLRTRERQQALELGRKLLEKEARRFRVNLKKVAPEEFERAAREFGCQKPDELLARIGFGKYAARQVLARLSAEPLVEPAPKRSGLRELGRRVARVFRLGEDSLRLRDSGGDLLMYRARCCNPIRGEAVIGYITRGRGIAVHARTCPNLENLLFDSERRIAVEWAGEGAEAYAVRLTVRARDRAGLLKEITSIIADARSNIRTADARADAERGAAVVELIFDVADLKQLERILAALRKIRGVEDVTRLTRFADASPSSPPAAR